MIAAMAWRVKYRKVDLDNRPVRKKLRVGTLGVHPKNRGGVYPGGLRCVTLAEDVLVTNGFLKEEVNHQVVVVEETPVDEIRSRGDEYVTGLTYNVEASRRDELLSTCFDTPYDEVWHKLLGHNHIVLVMRAFLTKAKWDMPRNAAKQLDLCDEAGRLSLTAVAEHPNGKEMAELIADGLDCEILAWRMEVEEPGAASAISHALNVGHQVALRTTELTAVAVLKGEIILQMSKDVGQRVAFRTVRDRVRAELGVTADDPDLPDVFDFLIAIGVGTNTYAEDLLAFGACFVNSKKRQMRFSAFKVAYRMCTEAPCAKVAVMKRAYRKKPSNGFCPSPEEAWANVEWNRLRKLEEVLRFFHATCKQKLEALKPQSRNTLLANIDVAAAEAFFATESSKPKATLGVIETSLLEVTRKFLPELGIEQDHVAKGDLAWIDFSRASTATATAVAGSSSSATNVINFDETTGAQLNTQVSFQTSPPPPTMVVVLPFREWLINNAEMGASEADKGAAVAVLHNLHDTFDVSSQKVDVVFLRGVYVVATDTVPPAGILLPPCVPKQSKVFDKSDHPCAVPMDGKTLPGPEGRGPVRAFKVWLVPELKMPKQKGDSTAVADNTAVADSDKAPEWIWNQGGGETMHPFWAVRRMTAQQLAKAALQTEPGETKPRFNCEVVVRQMTSCIVSTIEGNVYSRARMFDVPFLTNRDEVKKGEELLLEISEKQKTKGGEKKRTWRDADNEDEKNAQKAAVAEQRIKRSREAE